MSLVNYYASSDEENSGNEEEAEDREEADDVESKADVHEKDSKPDASSSMAMFASLPAPTSQINEPEEEEDIKYPIATATVSSSTLSRGLLNLPAPKRRSNQPIKITAPALPEPNSDDEDDEPSTKKVKPAKGLSELFAMLPKPRNATLKQTNRTLIPYTLTKKPAAAKPPQRLAAKPSPSRPPAAASASAKRAAATATIAGGGGGGGSNDEEEETGTSSFFSFGEPAVAPSVPAVSVTPVSEVNRFKALVTSSSSAPSEDGPSSSANPAPSTTTKATGESVHNRDWPSVASSVPYNLEPSGTPRDSPPAFQTSDPPSGQDAPLSFSKPMPTAMQYGQPAGQYAQTQAYSAPYGYDYSQYNQPYQGSDPEVPVDGQPTGSGPAQSNESLSGLAEDKEFQRLMGKRNVSREAINVVDIAADEQIGPTNHLDWMKKNLSEEKEFRAKLRKEQLPSGQQKRKHQITYLAHQAKERELELKNQWANNRQTRKDTQMKYGF